MLRCYRVLDTLSLFAALMLLFLYLRAFHGEALATYGVLLAQTDRFERAGVIYGLLLLVPTSVIHNVIRCGRWCPSS